MSSFNEALLSTLRGHWRFSMLSIVVFLAVWAIFKVIYFPADVQFFKLINQLSHDNLVLGQVLLFLGWLGGDTLWMMLVPLLTLVRSSEHRRGTALLLASASTISILAITALKPGFDLPRPSRVLSDVYLMVPAPSTPSFPSGHSSMAFVVASILCLRHRRLLLPLIGLGLLTAFTMVYAGVHFPSDTIAGGLLGILIGSFMCKFGSNARL